MVAAGWSLAQIHDLPAPAAFYHCMLCQRHRYVAMDDATAAANMAHYDEATQRKIRSEIAVMTAGPGRLVRWIDTQSPQVRAAVAECDRELEETIRRIEKESGRAVTADQATNGWLGKLVRGMKD